MFKKLFLLVFIASVSIAAQAGEKVLFVGSSTIAAWKTLAEDFPGLSTVNRGVVGSQYRDLLTTGFEKLITQERPARLVVYSGDNDLAAGKTPEEVAADARSLFLRTHSRLSDTLIFVLSVKPSPARVALLEKMGKTNVLLRKVAAELPYVEYVDVHTPMLNEKGLPRPELFRKDKLHMTRQGYVLWTSILRPYLMGQ